MCIQAKSAASAAEERASAEAQRARLLQEQLHQTEDSCESVFADLTSAQTARTEAERRLAERERASGRHIAIMTGFALEQTRAMEVRGSHPVTPPPACTAGCPYGPPLSKSRPCHMGSHARLCYWLQNSDTQAKLPTHDAHQVPVFHQHPRLPLQPASIPH